MTFAIPVGGAGWVRVGEQVNSASQLSQRGKRDSGPRDGRSETVITLRTSARAPDMQVLRRSLLLGQSAADQGLSIHLDFNHVTRLERGDGVSQIRIQI